MARFDLSDEEWVITAPLLPAQGRGPKRKDDYKVLTVPSTFLEPAHPGVIYLTDMVQEQQFIIIIYAGGEGGIWQGVFESLAQECEDVLVFMDAS